MRCRRPLLSRIRKASQDNRHAYHRDGGISADDRHVGDPRGTVFSDPVETGFLRKGSGVRRELHGDAKPCYAAISRQLPV